MDKPIHNKSKWIQKLQEGLTEMENMITGIQDALKTHNFGSVVIFCNKDLTAKTLGSAFALSEFLKTLNIKSNVFIKNRAEVKEGYPEFISVIREPHFLAICVDCKRITDIETDDYKKSTMLLNIYGPINVKSFGVLNFLAHGVSCSAEIIYKEIADYCDRNRVVFPTPVAQWLYVGLIGGTKRFSNNIKPNTMLVAKLLLDMKIDYKQANFMFEKKKSTILKSQEIILNKMQRDGRIAYAIVNKDDITPKITLSDFKSAIYVFRHIEDIDVWCIFLQTDAKGYDVLLQGKESAEFKLRSVARKNNGDGDNLTAIAHIMNFDIGKVLADINHAIKRGVVSVDSSEEDDKDDFE